MGAAAVLVGCEQEVEAPVEVVRAIKSYTVTEVASGQTRKYSGVVHATDSSTLSFQVAGNVKEMRVNQGDRVKKDQVLAVLDDHGLRQAELDQHRELLEEAKINLNRLENLGRTQTISRSKLDEARYRWLNCVVLTTGTGTVTSSRRQVELAHQYEATAILTTGDYLLHLAETAREMGLDPEKDLKL